MTTATKDTLDSLPMKKPARRWRNRFKATERIVSSSTGDVKKRGSVVESEEVYPSEDVAETAAEKLRLQSLALHGEVYWKYLGAFPIEDQQ